MFVQETSETRGSLSHAIIWKECLKQIKENVTLMTYNTWFLPIKPLELNNSTLKVQLPK
jgi:chromosomal replication initiator protein